MRWIALVLLACVYVALGARQVPVWTSDPTLWKHAFEQAPLKERPAINYARALYGIGNDVEAKRVLAAADALTRRGRR